VAGGDSLSALAMLARVESAFDVAVPLSGFAEKPTIENLLALIENPSRDEGGALSPRVVTLRRGVGLPAEPLFVVPGAGSDVSRLFPLAARWSSARALCGFQWRGIDGREPADESIEVMASRFLEAMSQVQPAGRYHLCGTSFGGQVAFEMARRLAERGDEVGDLVLVDSRLPGWIRPEGYSLRKALARLPYGLNPVGGRRELSWGAIRRGFAQRKQVRAAVRAARASLREGQRVPHTARYFYLLHTALNASRRHQMKPYPGDALVLHTAPDVPANLFRCDAALGWRPLIGGRLELAEIPGHHGEFLLEPHAAVLADLLSGR
jgi:thioesterase domain-containing protein